MTRLIHRLSFITRVVGILSVAGSIAFAQQPQYPYAVDTKPSRGTQVPPSGLTRSQVAHQLGVGVTAVHRLRVNGELHPQRDDAGVWRYDPADVIRAAATRGVRNLRTAGDVAAEAFRMFDQGGELKDIVSALRVTPAEVRRLYKEWQSSLDDPPPAPEPTGPGLLDEDPRAEEAFLRAMAQATGLAFPQTRKPQK